MFILFSVKIISSQSFNFNFNVIKYEISFSKKNDTLFEKITITNIAKESIFIPLETEDNLYFFQIENCFYSYIGLKNTKYGPTNIDGESILYELKSQKSIVKEVSSKINQTDSFKFNYYFSIDFLAINMCKSKQIKINSILHLKTSDYVMNCTSFYAKLED